MNTPIVEILTGDLQGKHAFVTNSFDKKYIDVTPLDGGPLDSYQLLKSDVRYISTDWESVGIKLPTDGQRVQFLPKSGNLFNGWYRFGRFFRGDGVTQSVASILGTYTYSAVLIWKPLTDG